MEEYFHAPHIERTGAVSDFFYIWLAHLLSSIVFLALLPVVWAWRTGQFAGQKRARSLALVPDILSDAELPDDRYCGREQ